ncbi:hypothetical protein CCP4SC76_2680001 [Gammaproteobacteria bacterium]
METFIPWRLIKRNVRREIITPLDAPEQFRIEAGIERRELKAAEETPLVRALGLAYFWRGLMESGRLKTLSEIAEVEGIHVSRVRDFMRLTLLAIRAIVQVGRTSIICKTGIICTNPPGV